MKTNHVFRNSGKHSTRQSGGHASFIASKRFRSSLVWNAKGTGLAQGECKGYRTTKRRFSRNNILVQYITWCANIPCILPLIYYHSTVIINEKIINIPCIYIHMMPINISQFPIYWWWWSFVMGERHQQSLAKQIGCHQSTWQQLVAVPDLFPQCLLETGHYIITWTRNPKMSGNFQP